MKASAQARTLELPSFTSPHVWRVKLYRGTYVHFLAAGASLETGLALCGGNCVTSLETGLALCGGNCVTSLERVDKWSRVVASNAPLCQSCVAIASRGRMIVEEKP